MADRWYEIEDGRLYACRQDDGMKFLRNPDCEITRVELCAEEDAANLYPDKYRVATRK